MGIKSPAVYGLDSNILDLPNKVQYFKNFFIRDTIHLENKSSSIISILSVQSNVSMLKLSLCDNSILYKSQNKLKRGLIVKCELKVELKIKSVGVVKFYKREFFKPVYILVPEFIKGESVLSMIRKKQYTSFIIVENINTQVVDNNTINFSMSSLVNISFK